MLSEYCTELDDSIKRRYLKKNPITIPDQQFDTKCLPPIKAMDLLSYLVLETSFYTKEQFKAYKSLEYAPCQQRVCSLPTANKWKYSLRRILNVEENHDEGTGDRYLVELELQEIASGKSARFSEYVYKPWGAETLCSPEGMAWNKSAVINIILTTGNNQGRWILHFLKNMARIYKKTKDSKFNVIVVDFDSKDLDLENVLKQAAIPSYQYAIIKDKFRKVVGLNQAADLIRDPNSILFVMDLHIDIPYHFLDDVRKHCVQQKMAYSPLLVRLECGATPRSPLGFWEFDGLGLIGLYKSDWNKVGGMNVKEYSVRWGGEDWELTDRILENALEVERLKMLHFFHYFHTKKGMWSDTRTPSADFTEKYWY